ncbi:MAG: choice-of-anchor D domain-containing protein [Thiotrichaceae bacterium]
MPWVVPDLNPKLQVNVDTSLAEAKDATIDLGTGIVGNTLSKTFTLKNVGYSNLVFSANSPVYAGTGTVTAGVYADADKTLGPRALNTTTDGSCATALSPSGEQTTFELAMSSATAGSFTGVVTVASNDAIYPSYTFKVKGVFQDAPPPPPLSPEIGVLFGTTEIQTDATTAIDFGATDIGTPITKDITIKNVGIGAEDLLVTSVNFLGQNGQPSSNFKTVGTVANRVAQLSETTITLQFSPTVAGTFNETLEIFNTDRANGGTYDSGAAENPFRIQLKGVANTTVSTGPALSIAPAPTNGTVSSDTGGINCGDTATTCTANYATGTTVKLTATPASGSTFTSWSGNCSGTTNPLSLTMDVAKTCTATFTGGTTPPPTTTTQTLTVTKTGNGKIVSQPTGIDCGTTCTSSLNTGTSVVLTATPDTGATFTSWGGDCASAATSPTATVTLDAAKNCTATFGTATVPSNNFALTLTAPTNGVVISQPAGINCGTGMTSCSGNFTANNIVALTATPDTGATFTSWGGDCTGATNQLILTMDAAKNCTATFTPAAAATQTLTVTKTGNGSISSNPVGISCGVDCSKSFTQETSVVLTATPDQGSTFTGWSGASTAQRQVSPSQWMQQKVVLLPSHPAELPAERAAQPISVHVPQQRLVQLRAGRLWIASRGRV